VEKDSASLAVHDIDLPRMIVPIFGIRGHLNRSKPCAVGNAGATLWAAWSTYVPWPWLQCFLTMGVFGFTGHKPHHLLAHSPWIDPEGDQHSATNTFALAYETEEHVFGTDITVAKLNGFPQRQFEHLLGPRGKRWSTARRRLGHSDCLLDLLAYGFEGDIEGFERLRRYPFPLGDEPEKDVLSADEAVVKEPSLLLGQSEHPPSFIGEAFEHSFKDTGRYPFWSTAGSPSKCGGVPPIQQCTGASCAGDKMERRLRVSGFSNHTSSEDASYTGIRADPSSDPASDVGSSHSRSAS
jgi:hypothetical protein